MQTCLGLDIETAKSPNSMPWRHGYYLSCLSLSYPNDTCRSWVFHHDNSPNEPYEYDRLFKEIQAEIDLYDVVAAHNAKFELNNLRRHLTFKDIHCTMVAEYLLEYQDKSNLNLNAVGDKYGLTLKDVRVKTLWDSGVDTAMVPLSILLPYCEQDARKARIIAERQVHNLYNKGLWKTFHLQMRWLDMLSHMECNGMGWDKNEADNIVFKYNKFHNVLNSKIKKLTTNVCSGHDLNLSSKDELSILLYGGILTKKEKVPVIRTKNIKTKVPYVFTYKDGTEKIKWRWKDHPDTKYIRIVWGTKEYPLKGLGIVPRKGTETKKSTSAKPFYKTDKDTLPFLRTSTATQKAVIKMLMKKSSIDKVVSTFVGDNGKGLINKIGTDGKLHTNYNQAITATGRLSSSDPNSQNFPRSGTSPIKRCIIPRFDRILNGDLSQVELRVPAQLSQDAVMIKEITNGEDLHSNAVTQIMLLPLNKLNRYYAKVFNFRMIFRGTAWGFHKDPNMPNFGIEGWQTVVDAFWKKYFGLDKWHKKIIKHVIDGDGTLSMFTGRRFKFKLGYQGKYNESQISNSPVQGFAGGDLLPLAAVIIWDAMKRGNFKSLPILTVHDSLVFDTVKREEKRLARLVMRVFNSLPAYIEQYWGYKWQVPLTGEIESGGNYGNQKEFIV